MVEPESARSPQGALRRLARRPAAVTALLAAAALAVAAMAGAGSVAVSGLQLVAATSIFVSPSGLDSNPGTQAAPTTLTHAQQLVQSANNSMTGDIDVVLADGAYRLSQPLSFGPGDSGTNGHNVVWGAAAGAHPVISGAAKIGGWTQFDAGRNIWVAQAPSGLKTRQLYVNGTRVARAHGTLPVTVTRTSTPAPGYNASAATMAGWKNPSGATPTIEFVYTGGLGAWTEPRCPVDSMSGTFIRMAEPCWNNSTLRACCFSDPKHRAYNLVGRMAITESPTQVENAFQLLNSPGEWFLDEGSSKLYYIPRSGESMTTADVEAPRLESLVRGAGTASSPVHNLVFNGIQFSYATWLGPSTPTGFSEIQANYQVTGDHGYLTQGLCDVPPAGHHGDCPYGAWTQTPGNVSFTFDQSIQLTNDAFVHLGAAGLALGDGSQHDLVKGSVFTDISGSGIELGNVDMPLATGSAQTLNDTITDNHVFNLPAEYHGGIGIDVGYAASSSVTHNQVDHTSYTGISIGWAGWPDKEQQPARPNFSHDNSISNNLIFNHMSLLNDGGGIYTQGITGSSLATGEKVMGNVIHDQKGAGHMIYTDNGCTFENIVGNGLYNTGAANAWSSRHHDYRAGATTTYDPTNVLNNYWENGVGNTSSSGVTVSGNHAITSPSQIPASIVNNAGIEPGFKGILSWHPAG
jgi:Right handed beta helix region